MIKLSITAITNTNRYHVSVSMLDRYSIHDTIAEFGILAHQFWKSIQKIKEDIIEINCKISEEEKDHYSKYRLGPCMIPHLLSHQIYDIIYYMARSICEELEKCMDLKNYQWDV